jgi:hypothetical protein
LEAIPRIVRTWHRTNIGEMFKYDVEVIMLKKVLCIAMLIAASTTAAFASCGGHAPFTFTTVGGSQVVDVSMGADFSL